MKRILLFISLMLAVVGKVVCENLIVQGDTYEYTVTDGENEVATLKLQLSNPCTVGDWLTLDIPANVWVITEISPVSGVTAASTSLVIPAGNIIATKENSFETATHPIKILFAKITDWHGVRFEGEMIAILRYSLPYSVEFLWPIAPMQIQNYSGAYETHLVTLNYSYKTGYTANNFHISFPIEGEISYKDFFGTSVTDYRLTTENTLTDANAYTCTMEGENLNVTYVRQFSHNGWNALYVPFDAPASAWEANGYTVAELKEVEYNSTENCDVMHWKKLTGDATVEHGKPYIVRHAAGDVSSTFSNVHVYPYTNVTDEGTVSCSYSISGGNTYTYTLCGNYEEKISNSGSMPSVWYAMHEGNFWRAGSTAILSANRLYLTIWDGYQYRTVPEGGTRVMVDGEVVGIIEHIFEPQLLIDDNYYDVLGRRIDNPQAGQLYIHQGKKIIYSE